MRAIMVFVILTIIAAIVFPMVLGGGRGEIWNYNSDGYIYTGSDSSWYSSYLRSDGSGTETSYDYSYRNSYSYIGSGNVKQWNYQYK